MVHKFIRQLPRISPSFATLWRRTMWWPAHFHWTNVSKFRLFWSLGSFLYIYKISQTQVQRNLLNESPLVSETKWSSWFRWKCLCFSPTLKNCKFYKKNQFYQKKPIPIGWIDIGSKPVPSKTSILHKNGKLNRKSLSLSVEKKWPSKWECVHCRLWQIWQNISDPLCIFEQCTNLEFETI